jgi:hypothetical protein
MDKPYKFMVIERGTRNTYGADKIEDALERADNERTTGCRTERIDLYALINTDPRTDGR